MTTVELPFPPKALSPNARVHWGQKARTTAKYRSDCGYMAKSQGLRKMVAETILVTTTFCPPDRRHRDTDNMIASAKPLYDALADVTGVDDKRFRMGKPIISDPFPPHGKVIVELESV